MSFKRLFGLFILSLGIALLIAGLFFKGGSARGTEIFIESTPTPDRLAEPTLPASPSQADHGAQIYWLSCMPCHGDQGQGLTDEFRRTYPPEEEYCWESGCHGERPYEDGFKLPKSIPAVIGPETLQKFSSAAILHAYIKAAMPFWKPGSLADEESWAVTSFLLRENGLWNGRVELNASNAGDVTIPRGVATPSPMPEQAHGPGGNGFILLAALSVLIVFLFIVYRFKYKTTVEKED